MRGSFLAVLFFFTFILKLQAEGQCDSAIQRLTQAEGITAASFSVPATTTAQLGKDSNQLYKPEWNAYAVPGDGSFQSRVNFSFKGDQTDASINLFIRAASNVAPATTKVSVGNETLVATRELSNPIANSSAHFLQLDLPRDARGAFIDLNLATEVLNYIAQKSLPNEKYVYVLNDPSVITALNQELESLLRAADFGLPSPRLANLESDLPLASRYFYDDEQDSLFPHLKLTDFHESIHVLRTHLQLRENLMRVFSKTPFGQSMLASGDWIVDIELEGFDVMAGLQRDDPHGLEAWLNDNPDEKDVRPLVYRYRIQLTRNF